jgi:alpha,alpha-trehalase
MASQTQTLSLVGIEAVVFDLDGVVTDTASAHFDAWKETFDDFLAARDGEDFEAFSLDDYQEYVDGKPRYEGVESFLESRGIALAWGEPGDPADKETIYGVGTAKNDRYQAFLAEGNVEVFDDAVAFIDDLRERGIKTAIVSSSKNCKTVLDVAGLAHLFSARVDGNDLSGSNGGLAGKPEPDMFVEAAGRLGVATCQAIVVEDAIAGVEAGRRGHFASVIGVARGDDFRQLEEAGADIVISSFENLKINPAGEIMAQKLDSAMTSIDEIVKKLGDHEPAVFLDYDGTLSPIVDDPAQAVLSPQMRQAVEHLGKKCTVAVVSGRDLGDVRERVGIDTIAYAGSHGFDILGPEGRDFTLEKGEEFLPALDRAETELRERVGRIEGAQIERKRYSLAVHYRQVSEKDVPSVEKQVDQVVEEIADHTHSLKKTCGKKVFDLQPDIDWHKGKAVNWLLEELGLDTPDVVPMYIGDDVTDEDAFEALAGRGITIAVQEVQAPTAAEYRLSNPDEVRQFLDTLADRLSS